LEEENTYNAKRQEEIHKKGFDFSNSLNYNSIKVGTKTLDGATLSSLGTYRYAHANFGDKRTVL